MGGHEPITVNLPKDGQARRLAGHSDTIDIGFNIQLVSNNDNILTLRDLYKVYGRWRRDLRQSAGDIGGRIIVPARPTHELKLRRQDRGNRSFITARHRFRPGFYKRWSIITIKPTGMHRTGHHQSRSEYDYSLHHLNTPFVSAHAGSLSARLNARADA